jgi:hypothetical protein
MANQRLDRELETRVEEERPKQWSPPELLPEPKRQPGFAYRWIRVETLNAPDPRNLSAKLREGWEPVKIEEQPQFQMLVDPTSRFKDNIEVGGLLLCKTPEEFTVQRNQHYMNQAQANSDAVDNNLMRENDPRMPLFKERKTSVSFGKGN